MPSTAIVSNAQRDRMVTVPAGREARRDTGIQGGFASRPGRLRGLLRQRVAIPGPLPGCSLSDRGWPFPLSVTGRRPRRGRALPGFTNRLIALADRTWGGAEPPAARLSTHSALRVSLLRRTRAGRAARPGTGRSR